MRAPRDNRVTQQYGRRGLQGAIQMLETTQEAKVAVRVLRRYLKKFGPAGEKVSHTDALHLLAKMFSCKTWNELESYLKKDDSAQPKRPTLTAEHDKVKVGEKGEMRTRDGRPIAGTFDLVPGRAEGSLATRNPDGTLNVHHAGGTEVFWDDQKTQIREGEQLFLDEDGEIVRESEIILVEEGAPFDDEEDEDYEGED
jgi:hypothetical protein